MSEILLYVFLQKRKTIISLEEFRHCSYPFPHNLVMDTSSTVPTFQLKQKRETSINNKNIRIIQRFMHWGASASCMYSILIVDCKTINPQKNAQIILIFLWLHLKLLNKNGIFLIFVISLQRAKKQYKFKAFCRQKIKNLTRPKKDVPHHD